MDLVGLAEIATMAGTTKQAVSNWRSRHPDFPAPSANPKSGPVFRRDQVAAWLRRRGTEVQIHDRVRPTRVLRHFKYLNTDLVREFLAQFEGGIFDEEQVRTEGTRHKGLGAGVGAGAASVHAEFSGEAVTGQERVQRQTGASEFARLYEHLQRDDLIQSLPNFDEIIWGALTPGEIVEIPVVVALPGILKLLQLAAGFQSLLPMVEAASPVTPQQREMLKMMGDFAAAVDTGPLTVIAVAAAAPRFKMVVPLAREYLHVSQDSMEGEATLVAKIQRKLNKGETVSAIELFPGMNRMGRKQLDSLNRSLRGGPSGLDLGASTVSYPGAVMTVVGIFQ